MGQAQKVCEPMSSRTVRDDLAFKRFSTILSHAVAATAQWLMWQLLKGVQYSHVRRVLHRDLKPANLLVDRATLGLKIADFGLARVFTPPLRPYTHEVSTLRGGRRGTAAMRLGR